MTLKISSSRRDPERHPIEIVERKGLGHPDTLSDHLAEALSRAYSLYTQARFGMVLRHQFDKTAMMCGRCRVSFGGGEMIEPIRILVNGRASARLGDEVVPVRDILMKTVREFVIERLPNLDPDRDVRVLYEVRDGLYSTTGGVFGDDAANAASIHYRFHPRTLDDLPESREVQSNDTSLGCASGPYSPLEMLVLEIEGRLRSRGEADPLPWVGSDIKTMAVRRGHELTLTVAAPVLCAPTPNIKSYFERVEIMEKLIREAAAEMMPDHQVTDLRVNTADDVEGRKLYTNFTGSSIESGDEGMVGRGNRMGGLISPLRPWTMEGISGKNPVYHVGKVYSVAAFEVAQRLAAKGIPTSVYLLNRMGAPLRTPLVAHVEVDPEHLEARQMISEELEAVLCDLPSLTQAILAERYRLA